MIKKFISGDVVVAKINDFVTIERDDWIPFMPEIVNSYLRELGVFSNNTLQDPIDVSVVDYKIDLNREIPNIYTLERIVYNSNELVPIMNLQTRTREGIDEMENKGENWFNAERYPYVFFPFETGTVTVHYTAIESTENTNLKLTFPNIPDIDTVIDNAVYYSIYRLLLKGYKLPPYSLNNNPYTNPMILYKNGLKMARIDTNAISNKDRKIISRMDNTLFNDNPLNKHVR